MKSPEQNRNVMIAHLGLVHEFHVAFNLPAPAEAVKLDRKTALLRAHLNMEETSELLHAISAGNVVEQLDALADIEYVILGQLVVAGLRTHFHNLPVARINTRNMSNEWVAGQLSAMVGRLTTDLLAFEEFEHNFPGPAVTTLLSSSALALELVYQLAERLGFGIDEVFDPAVREVHRSNMSKLDENGKPILNEAGRVVKGPLYTKPDLAQFLTLE